MAMAAKFASYLLQQTAPVVAPVRPEPEQSQSKSFISATATGEIMQQYCR